MRAVEKAAGVTSAFLLVGAGAAYVTFEGLSALARVAERLSWGDSTKLGAMVVAANAEAARAAAAGERAI
jgi:hypothetical protein